LLVIAYCRGAYDIIAGIEILRQAYAEAPMHKVVIHPSTRPPGNRVPLNMNKT